MSIYTKQQYEDVAGILKDQLSSAAPLNWVGHIAEVETNATVKRIAYRFADLFAADNPLRCTWCADVGTRFCDVPGQEHTFDSGFDREQFLADCGLRSLDVDAKPRRLEKTHDEIDPTGYGAALRRLRRG